MSDWVRIGRAAMVSGTVASLVTTAVLAFASRREGGSLVQPTNATSHWLHGDRAGLVRRQDMEHTALGYATHHASTVFWALLFETLRARSPRDSPGSTIRYAGLTAGIAAVVDYLLVPRRLTPGWEFVLSKKAIGGVFLALAAGLALGGALTSARDH